MSPSTLPAPVAATASAGHNAPVLDVVVPVHNEENDLEPCVRRLHAHLSTGFPYPFRITVADNASTDGTSRIAAELAAELPEVSFVHADGQGAWPGAQARLVGLRRAGARVHGRRPVHRPGRAAAPGGAAHLRPLRSGHRLPAVARLPGGPRPQAGDHLALLQPAAARHARGPLLRRAVRLQGDARRRRGPAAALGGGHRLVLRHRAAGARRTRRAAHPRGAGRLDRRPGQPRRHLCPRSWPTCPGHRPAGQGAGDRQPAAGEPARAARAHAAARGGRARRPAGPAAALRRRRHRQHARLPAAVRPAARDDRRPGGEPRRPPRHRRGEHGAQPPAHLRRARPRPRGGGSRPRASSPSPRASP